MLAHKFAAALRCTTFSSRVDHDGVDSSSCCFPRESVSFDPWNVTRSSPIGKRSVVLRYNRKKPEALFVATL